MGGIRELVHGSALYRISLAGRFHHGLAFLPQDPWPGDPKRANDLFQGIYDMGGETIRCGGASPWRERGAGARWRAELHGFDWLKHFRDAGGDSAVHVARALMASWLAQCDRYDPLIWRTDVLARRMVNWCLNADLLIRRADLTYRSVLMRSLARQARHLARTADQVQTGPEAVAAAVALTMLGYCMPESRAWAEKGLRLLAGRLNRQVLSDGGHVSRDPAALEAVLRDLVLLKRTMMDVGDPPPDALVNAVDRMTPTLRMLRHGDGGLALFNGATEGEAALIEITVRRSGVRGKPNLSAPRMGFERLEGRRALVICDVGGPDPRPGVGHAGLMSFEMSSMKERLIVNSGAVLSVSSTWRAAMSSTAAHSTLTLDNTNAVPVPEAGGRRRRPMACEAARTESADATWLDMSHDGYSQSHGYLCSRRLYLDAAGEDLRGEDTVRPAGARPRKSEFAVRFHLHPDVRPFVAQGGQDVLLQLKSGRGWRFRAGGAAPVLEEGVYLGDGRPRKTQQIVLYGSVAGEPVLMQWALSLIDGDRG